MLMAAAGQAGRGQYDHGVDRHATSITETELARVAPKGPSRRRAEQVDHVDRRFPGLLDSVITADDPALV